MSILREVFSFSSIKAISSSVMSLPLILLAVGLVSLRWLWPVARMFLIGRNIPCPRGYPIIGHIFEAPRSCNETFNSVERWHKTYGRMFKVWFCHLMVIILTDPADVKHVFASVAKNVNRPSYFTNAVRKFYGQSLLTLRDGKWKIHRKTANPMFSYSILKTFMSVFEEKAQVMSDKLAQVAEGQTVDMIQYTNSCLINAIMETVIGSKMANMQDQEELFIKALLRSDELLVELIVQPWLQIPLLQRLFPAWKEITYVEKFLSDLVEQLVSANLREYRTKTKPEGGDKTTRPNQFTSLLDLMIRESESEISDFSTDDIKGELVTFIIVGFVTTSSTLSFLLVLLGIHQDIQEEISRELDRVFGSDLRSANADDLANLVVLERAIKETLRLFPAAPVSPREVTEDIHLPSGNVLPAGSIVLIYLYRLHRDPESFYDPDSFVPDRWLPENSARIHTHAYLPFASGPRSCIGYKYALMQLKIVACHVLRRFRVETRLTMADLKNLNVSMILKLNGEYNVQLYKKNGTN